MFNILVIEDDEVIRKQLCLLLKNNAYNTCGIDNFKDIVKIISENKFDLILLDINLPYNDGFKICADVRNISDIPIIFVTSRNTDIDELMSITIGGDDFIAKPYNTQVLLARIDRLLKRFYKIEKVITEYNGILIDTSKNMISYKENNIELSKNEFKIFMFLIKNNGRIVSRIEIMEELWDSAMFINDNTLTVNISRIKNRLADIGVENFIKTKRGQGYLV